MPEIFGNTATTPLNPNAFGVDLSDYYTKEEVDNLVDNVDLSNYYNKKEVDTIVDDIKSLSANAIKTSKKGEIITVDDVSPIEHELKVNLTSDTITDFSTVKVSRYGKNLFPIDKDKWVYEVGNFTFDDEGVYGTHGDGASNYAMFSPKYPSGTYSFSAEFSYDGSTRILARYFDADGNIITSGLSNYNAFYKAFIIPVKDVVTFTIPDTVAYWQLGWVSVADKINAATSMKFPQLEFGDTITPYEQCVEQTATANADGTVEGLTSVSPYMVLLTDNPSVLINCTYNRDINAVLGNLETLLGGI